MTPRPLLIGGKRGLRRRLYQLPRVGIATPVFAGPQVRSGTLRDRAAYMPASASFKETSDRAESPVAVVPGLPYTNLACLPKGCGVGGAADFSSLGRRVAWHSKRPGKMTKSIHVGGRPVWAQISLQAILRNLEIIRKHVNGNGRHGVKRGSNGKRMVLAVVKSNAYGLGAVAISKALQKAGTEWFGVTCANEGVELRESGIRKRILVLTGFWPGEEKRLLENHLTPTVTRVDDLRHLERAAKNFLGKSGHRKSSRGKSSRVRFHLKINTGMNRLGISPSEVEAFASALADCPHLELEGTFTHFASAEDFIGGQTVAQEELFRL